MRLELGQPVATPGALALLERLGIEPGALLMRHQSGDWGDLDAEDTELNDDAAAAEGDDRGRILSAYELAEGHKVWIITEWDRSVTTLLLPSEY